MIAKSIGKRGFDPSLGRVGLFEAEMIAKSSESVGSSSDVGGMGSMWQKMPTVSSGEVAIHVGWGRGGDGRKRQLILVMQMQQREREKERTNKNTKSFKYLWN